ncbi:MAG: restriction endonuclease subunit S [Mesorhizobium sp.]|uniref:restriction endonuclease subunit S n=1 Tax=Mesorhizobium sp. TaxID=1871066 RepID=UPI001211A810|nr:restriction endonuclease subunit S [Mesorhizobium sp.]TIL56839.1 MAG: restriction endonuclease subunit S [Mesorhizobium sp.]
MTQQTKSEVKWISELPSHWRALPLRGLATEGRTSFVDGDWIEAPYITEDGVRLLQTGNVGIGQFREQGFRYVSEETFDALRCTEVNPGDVLICRLAEPVGRACLAPHLGVRMITSVDVCIMKPSSDNDRRFIVYLLSSPNYLSYMEGQCRGGTRDRVSRSFLGAVRVPVPPLLEQTAIAAFLDRETDKIDALLEQQERLIELLKEKRQALISHAVTKGLNPNAPMKASAVERLGHVPEHWTTTRLRFAVRLNPSKSELEELNENTTVSFLPMDAIGEDGTLALNSTRRLADVLSGYTYFREGDVAVAKITPCFENGKGALMRGLEGGIGFGTTELIVARPLPGLSTSEFLFWLFSSTMFRRLGEGSMYGAGGQKRVPDEFVRNFPIALPPFVEQAAIAEFLHRETARFDLLLREAEAAVSLLQERRAALISAAVTGKIDVRDVPRTDTKGAASAKKAVFA